MVTSTTTGTSSTPRRPGSSADGLGDGIDATALGDGSVAGNTQITFNFNSANINGNEEQALQTSMSNGGSVNINLVGGSVGAI